jgi:hypothetical protein
MPDKTHYCECKDYANNREGFHVLGFTQPEQNWSHPVYVEVVCIRCWTVFAKEVHLYRSQEERQGDN